METTGMIRRIDELGRIVIPKEIRRNLRIKDGSSLEILIEQDMLILKKSSSVNGLKEIANAYADAIYKSINSNVIITDRDVVIAMAGHLNKKYINMPISKYLEGVINSNKNVVQIDMEELEIADNCFEKCSYVVSPIMSNGCTVGTVILLREDKKITDVEEKILQTATIFLGKHIEE